VVLVHGGFVDGSGWEDVYRILRKDGYDVSIVQNPTTSLADDVAALVYIAAFAPDRGESVGALIKDPPPGAPVPADPAAAARPSRARQGPVRCQLRRRCQPGEG
jgi:hypothetical protein